MIDTAQTTLASLTVGTRGSALARWQTDWVIDHLKQSWPGLECPIKLFHTSGDKILDKPLPEIGGKGLFTEELENALRSGEINIAVHSLKDLPIDDAASLTLGAICTREDARDAVESREQQVPAPPFPVVEKNCHGKREKKRSMPRRKR